MTLPNSEDLAKLIDLAKDAVNKSSFGPFWESNSENLSKKAISPVNWQIFNMVLSGLIQRINFGKPAGLIDGKQTSGAEGR